MNNTLPVEKFAGDGLLFQEIDAINAETIKGAHSCPGSRERLIFLLFDWLFKNISTSNSFNNSNSFNTNDVEANALNQSNIGDNNDIDIDIAIHS